VVSQPNHRTEGIPSPLRRLRQFPRGLRFERLRGENYGTDDQIDAATVTILIIGYRTR
jgi:hypothetical protein